MNNIDSNMKHILTICSDMTSLIYYSTCLAALIQEDRACTSHTCPTRVAHVCHKCATYVPSCDSSHTQVECWYQSALLKLRRHIHAYTHTIYAYRPT